jgi:hypothetical protein
MHHKVHKFWEGHEILQNLHQSFVLCSASQIIGGDFAKFCDLLRIYELYQSIKMSWQCKVEDLQEGHKILQNHHFRFDVYYIQSNLRWIFRKKFWPSQNIWTLLKIMCAPCEKISTHCYKLDLRVRTNSMKIKLKNVLLILRVGFQAW